MLSRRGALDCHISFLFFFLGVDDLPINDSLTSMSPLVLLLLIMPKLRARNIHFALYVVNIITYFNVMLEKMNCSHVALNLLLNLTFELQV